MTLYEKLFLIALKDEKGTVIGGSTFLSYGLAGALLSWLLQQGRIEIVKNKVVVKDTALTEDLLLNEALDALRQSPKIRSVNYWIPHLTKQLRHLWKKVGDSLFSMGIVQREDYKILGIFPSVRYPITVYENKQTLVQELKDAVFAALKPESEMEALICLSAACQLLRRLFESDERREASRFARKLMKDNPIAKAVEQTIAAVQAAAT
jgi:hypothetical protein